MDATFTLQDAINLTSPKAFTALIKPAGATCNLGCTYCYYLDKKRFYGVNPSVLPDDLLEKFTIDYINSNKTPHLHFVWHGGEPLLAGLDFYKRAVAFQQKHNVERKSIANSIQTNGTLLNEEWCRFFKKNNFLVGISIDGPKDIHDCYRKNNSGVGSFDKTIRGLEMLTQYKVDFNALSVVSKCAHGRGREIYTFLKQQGVEHIQFLPSIDYIESIAGASRAVVVSPPASPESELAPWSVSSTEYGRFLIDVFDEWVVKDVGKIFVQIFDNTLSAWYGIEPLLCVYGETCGNSIAIEHNGDVYSCDHFVYPKHLLGNIQTKSLQEMVDSPNQIRFGLNKRNTLPNECFDCTYYFVCYGECPKRRNMKTADNRYKSSLCSGLKMFYKHTEPLFKYMCGLLRENRAPAEVMSFAKTL